MAESDRPREDSGGMSVREAGRRGGERVKAKYGPEFYEAIGRKGGQTPKARREASEAVPVGREAKPE